MSDPTARPDELLGEIRASLAHLEAEVAKLQTDVRALREQVAALQREQARHEGERVAAERVRLEQERARDRLGAWIRWVIPAVWATIAAVVTWLTTLVPNGWKK